ncbi:efflux RND transporter periplasmic adaptor subunit [Ancylothrix sp. C2]|uniref:efflux RND transporter periplasmic adaptor subunit n=1 Tax=Ancylothrix sp. D3o TaxID=2953691 RepID=UPI0021BAC232|nr:efflux RND transporter periplasmic adaptor subunit [Ancylothrix sp. D3o]MCT7948746.1 efflux RND transporter periplasmic adaptor subunit [Ancylothrix sp. D3o]
MRDKGKKPLKTGLKWLTVSGTLAAISTGGWLVYAQIINRPPEAVPVRLLKVEKDTIEIPINTSGTIELRGQQTLKAPADVTVDSIFVGVGNRVSKSQELLVLRDSETEANRNSQKAKIRQEEISLSANREKVYTATEKLKTAEQNLQDIITQRDSEKQTRLQELQVKLQKQELTLQSREQNILDKKQDLEEQQRELTTVEELDQKGFIAKTELNKQQQTVRAAEAALRESQTELNQQKLELQNLQLEAQKIEQEFQQKAQQDEEKLKTAREQKRQAEAELKEATTNVTTSTLTLQQAKITLQGIEQKLQDNIVTSPIDGVVLEVKVKAGDGVKVSEELLTLGDPSQEFVKLQLTTLDAAKIRPNQEARISVIGPQAQQYKGQVKSLSPIASTGTSNNTEGGTQTGTATVSATVQLDTPSRTLIPGGLVSVEIITQKISNIISLPIEALQREGPSAFVWVRDNQNKAKKKPVKLGLEGLTSIEIKSGLQAGEEVILPPPEPPLEEGMPLIIETETKPSKTRKKT